MKPIELDEYQLAAARHLKGWAAVEAPAGSGKTTLLVERVAFLIESGARPESILLLAYNTSAGETLRSRISQRLGNAVGSRVEARTFHSFSQSILNETMKDDPNWKRVKLLDTGAAGSSLRAMAEAISGCGVDGDAKDWVATSQFVRESAIDIDADDAVQKIRKLEPCGGDEDKAAAALRVCNAFQYEKAKKHFWDYCDMIYGLWLLTQRASPIIRELCKKYKHVMIDEAQDSTPARWDIIRFLGKDADSLLCVFDPRQSIYAHGAVDVSHLLRFKSSEAAHVYRLPVNRRSTDAIVEAGNAICRGYAWHSGDAVSLPDNGEGVRPVVWHTKDEHEEADKIAEEAMQLLTDAMAASEEEVAQKRPAPAPPTIVVLARTNARLLPIEQALKEVGLRTKVRGVPGGMWGSGEGRDVLAYLEAGAGKVSEEIANVANKPLRYIKKDLILALVGDSKGDFDVFVSAMKRKATPRSRSIGEFADLLSALRKMKFDQQVKLIENTMIEHVRKEQAKADDTSAMVSGANPDDDKAAAYRNICSVVGRFPSFAALQKSIAESKEDEEEFDVELSSCHRMKGGEADIIFLAGAAQGLFPHVKSKDVEEERRIFYVGLTRAKERLYISTGGAPSPFLRDLKPYVTEVGKPVAAPPPPPPGRNQPAAGGKIGSDQYRGIFVRRRSM